MTEHRAVILYIDDDPDYRDAIRMILEADGYSMVEAATAEEGIGVYERTKPDFVLVDLMMEEVDAGATFVKELRARGNTAPIYMLSSVGDMLRMNVDCGTLGVQGMLQKPLEPETLLAVLRNHLGAPAHAGRARPNFGDM